MLFNAIRVHLRVRFPAMRWDLVPEERDRRRERLVRAAVAENPATAEMIRDALEQAGIRSMLKNRDPIAAYGGAIGSPWTTEVWVLEGDADAAAAVLGGRPAPEPLAPPAVKRPRTARRWWSRWFGSRPN